jgi:hypothetical protein
MKNLLFQRLPDPKPCRFVPHWRERCGNIQINWHTVDTVPFLPRSRVAGYPVVQRDDGKWALGWHDDAPGPFPSRLFALQVASGEPAKPAAVKFRRIKIKTGGAHVASS